MKYILFTAFFATLFYFNPTFTNAANVKSESQSSRYETIKSPDEKYELLVFTISNKKENNETIKIEQNREIKIRKKGDSPLDEISLVKFNGQNPVFNWIGDDKLEIIFSQSVTESTTSYNELTIKVFKK